MCGNLSQEEIEALLREIPQDEEPLKEKTPPPSSAERRKPAPTPEAPAAAARPEAAAQPPADVPARKEPEAKAAEVKPAVFAEFPRNAATETPLAGMDVLLDVPLSITVELGRARCFVKDLLSLTVGSVVELDKLAGESVDVLVNGKVFAHGEVVVVDENFGVRITDIVSKGAADKGIRKTAQ